MLCSPPVDSREYLDCVKNGGTVISHVFCLPALYRKDVIPPHPGQNSFLDSGLVYLTRVLPARPLQEGCHTTTSRSEQLFGLWTSTSHVFCMPACPYRKDVIPPHPGQNSFRDSGPLIHLSAVLNRKDVIPPHSGQNSFLDAARESQTCSVC